VGGERCLATRRRVTIHDRGSSLLRAAMRLDYFMLMPALARLSWRAALWWGRRRGDLRFWWRSDGREAAIANLRHAYHGTLGDEAARRIIRECFRTQTCEESETFFYTDLTPPGLQRFVTIEGRENLDAALAGGRGAIVFSSHYGSMCLAIIALAHLGYRTHVIARSLEPDENPLHEIVRRYGEAKVSALERITGIPFIIPGQPGAMDRMRAALAAGEVLYMLLSVPPELARHRCRIRFLGHPAELPIGAEYIATETGAPLVPFTVRRCARGVHHVLSIGPRVPGPEAGAGTMQRCVDVLEREIRLDPSQFFMWEYARSFWVEGEDEPAETAVDGVGPRG
jgi:lauroyl/myristoyl acyltransferase